MASIQTAVINTPLAVLLITKKGEEKRKYVGSLFFGQILTIFADFVSLHFNRLNSNPRLARCTIPIIKTLRPNSDSVNSIIQFRFVLFLGAVPRFGAVLTAFIGVVIFVHHFCTIRNKEWRHLVHGDTGSPLQILQLLH